MKDILEQVLEDKKVFENEYSGHLKGIKCKVCLKPMKTNKKHAKYYDNGWIPEYHKKCKNVLSIFE